MRTLSRRSLATAAGMTAGLAAVLAPNVAYAAPAPDGSSTELLPAKPQQVTPQDTCGQNRLIVTNGLVAYTEVFCDKGNVVVKGWISDTRRDNTCARIWASFIDHTDTFADCSVDGTAREFKFAGPGNTVFFSVAPAF